MISRGGSSMKMVNEAFPTIVLCAVFLLAAPHVSHAGKKGQLDESSIREFVEQTTEITSKNTSMSPDQVRAYLELHLHKKGFFKSEIRYNIPGYPSQTNTLSLDKPQFIDSILSGQQALEDYEIKLNIEEINISRDGGKATLRTSSIERGMMPVPREDGKSESIPVEGSSTCSQIIMLENGEQQMYSANCVTEITFLTPF